MWVTGVWGRFGWGQQCCCRPAQEPVPRILALSESCLVERDKATYSVTTLHPLHDVFALIRYTDDPQNFGIEYVTGAYRRYSCADR